MACPALSTKLLIRSVPIADKDDGVVITGSLNTLVLKDTVWVLVIESKRASFSVEAGLAQILSYMLASPAPEKPCFGLITSGGSFMFVELAKGNPPYYATSSLFGMRTDGNQFSKIGNQFST